jgi:hypothetical protein
MASFVGNYNEINRLLTNTDWNLELAQGDIDGLWNRFADKISSTLYVIQLSDRVYNDALLDPWSYGNITTDTTMASFVHLKRFLVLW